MSKLPDVAYVFEAGHPFQADAHKLIESYTRYPQLKSIYHHEGHAFLPKSDAVWLQAADLFAWEYGKYKDETVDQPLRLARKSLRALVEGNQDRFWIKDLSGDALDQLLSGIPYAPVVKD